MLSIATSDLSRACPTRIRPSQPHHQHQHHQQLRGHSPDGSLPWLDGGYKDWEHFHGAPFGDYQLWVMRDELIPQYYK